MTNRDMERERERREWEQNELQDLDDLQAKHARIDERLEVGLHRLAELSRTMALPTQAHAAFLLFCCLQLLQQLTPEARELCHSNACFLL